ncbi:MAG: MobF family relaxase [Beijerinckiaceae bacterium]
MLGLGRDAGSYYTNDSLSETHPRDRDEYYTRDGGGRWWSTGSTIVQNGATIDKESFRDLCAGFHPAHGGSVVRAAGPGHRAGLDVSFSAPKSFSILWMSGSESQRAELERIQREAVDEALAFVVKEKLVEARLGAGGFIREVPSDLIIARYDHFTSREGDPQIHTHAVFINVAGCADGKWRAIETDSLYKNQLAVGAAYRTALAERLVARGFRMHEAGQDQIEIDGITPDSIEAFSKRSHQLEAVAGRDKSAAQKELATLTTRQSKSEIPTGPELEKRWGQELAALDIVPWTEALEAGRTRVPAPAPHQDLDPYFDLPEIDGVGPVAIAASVLFRTQNVIDRRELLRLSLAEASKQGVSIKTVYAELDRYEQDMTLVRLADAHLGRVPDSTRGSAWTTPKIASCEAAMLRASQRINEYEWISSEILERALQNAPYLSEEQRAAVTLAAGRDGVCSIEAGAGTGKTTLAKVIASAASDAGLKVIGLAPLWVAADELSSSIGITAQAITKWRTAEGPANLDRDTILLVDEAGMVGTRDLSLILTSAQASGSKVVLLGDRRQLQSVPGASALAAVQDMLDRQATMTEVKRQTIAWQRAASTLMSRGDSEAGLRAYARNGMIELANGDVAAEARVMETWTDFRQRYGDDVLIVTRRNIDANSLNKAARNVRRTEGRFSGPDVALASTDRDGNPRELTLAAGDRIRFGETLRAHGIRNGTRGTVTSLVQEENGATRIVVRLDDGRIIEDQWPALARPGFGRKRNAPRVSLGYAGTAYSAQGRTAKAAVLYISRPTDSREIYVGLTRHTHAARVVVESDRLGALLRKKQADRRIPPTDAAILERLYQEAGRYAEKLNVVDYIENRASFIATGSIAMSRQETYLDIGRLVRSARDLASTQASYAYGPAPFRLARWIGAAIRERLGAIISPIEHRVRALLYPPVDRSLSRRRGGPDYDR